MLTGCGVGGDEGGSGKTAINFYAFNEPGGSYDKAVEDCNKEADGKYTISYVKLPTDANQQRELVVRRLAAEDDDIDIIGMDVIWTAEFAAAEWILPWEGENERVATEGKLDGPRRSVEFEDKVWGLPFTSNTQLLWYRKDEVGTVPDDITWDQLIDDAVEKETAIEVQGAQYEGLTVWINSLIAGAGGQIVNEAGDVKVDSSATKAAEIVSKLGTSKAAPPGHGHQQGGRGPHRLRGGALLLRDQLPVHLPERRGREQEVPGVDRLGALPAHRGRRAEPPAPRRHQPRHLQVLRDPGPRLRGRQVHGQRGPPGDRGGARRPAAHDRVGLRRPRRSRTPTRSPTCCRSRSTRPRRAR